MGGVIAPGLAISAEALFSRAARLSRVDVKKPAKVVGTNTIAHMQSGLYYGYIGLVDGILERILNETEAGPGLGERPLPRSLPPAAWRASSSMIQGSSRPSMTCSRSTGCA